MTEQRNDENGWEKAQKQNDVLWERQPTTPVETSSEPDLSRPDKPAPSKSKSKKPIWGAIIGFVIVGLRILLLVFGSQVFGDDVPSQASSPLPPPCTIECLALQDEVRAAFTAPDACDGSGPRLCIVPVGSISRDELEILASYYRVQYGLQVAVLPGIDVPADELENERHQFSAEQLLFIVRTQYALLDMDPAAVLIAVTTVDLYSPAIERWRYVFSLFNSNLKVGIVSNARMHFAATEAEKASPEFELRLRKQMNILVGALYFGLQRSPDPHNAMYDGILGPGDLDRMPPDLPVSRP